MPLTIDDRHGRRVVAMPRPVKVAPHETGPLDRATLAQRPPIEPSPHVVAHDPWLSHRPVAQREAGVHPLQPTHASATSPLVVSPHVVAHDPWLAERHVAQRGAGVHPLQPTHTSASSAPGHTTFAQPVRRASSPPVAYSPHAFDRPYQARAEGALLSVGDSRLSTVQPRHHDGGLLGEVGHFVHEVRTLARPVLDVAAVEPYAEYYLYYHAAKLINQLGGKAGPVGSVAGHILALPLTLDEARGLGGDVIYDLLKGESVRDERRPGFINPLHSYLPAWLRGPRTYLPGIGHRRVDFSW